jgi:cyclic pyranopterin phosphate synthase
MPEGKKEFIPHGEILTYEEIREVVETFTEFGVKSVRLTGGEPLVRKGIENLIFELKELKPIEEITLTTNGFFLKEKAKTLKESGLSRVNVSLDTLDPQKFAYITGTNEESFFKVLEGIEEAKKVGLNPVKVNTVLIRNFNDSEVGDFIKFSEKYGVEVRFIELMPVGGQLLSRDNFISAKEVKRFIEENWGELIPVKVKKMGPARSFKVKGTNAVLGFIPSVSEHFCHECNRIRLTSDGKLRICLMSDVEIDLKRILRSKNYRRERLKEAIKKAFLLKKRINGVAALESLGCSRKMFTIGG